MPNRETPAQRGLPDLCIELFGFAIQLQDGGDPGDAKSLERRIDGMFATLDRRAKDAEVDAAQVKIAQYALVALLDEIVLSSDWPAREEWSSRPLQLKYFNDVTAGEGFYTRLDELRGTKDRGRLDVLEVFATCLGLGFKGKFADPEKMENPRLMVSEISREIREARKQRTDELSGHWLPEDRVVRKVKTIPVWVVTAVCAGVLLVLFVLLDFALQSGMRRFEALTSESDAPTSNESDVPASNESQQRGEDR